MLCYVMLCYIMLCYVMLCYAMLCYAMLCYAIICSLIGNLIGKGLQIERSRECDESRPRIRAYREPPYSLW